MKVSNDCEAKGDCDQVGIEQRMRLGEWQQVEPAEKDGGSQRFTDPAKGKRAEGYAELDGGEKVVEILLQAADGAGSWNAGGQHLLDARVSDGDQGELRGHKESVGQNQQGYGDRLEQRKTVHLGVRIAFQGSGIRGRFFAPGNIAGTLAV
jgi:hypothetical protein